MSDIDFGDIVNCTPHDVHIAYDIDGKQYQVTVPARREHTLRVEPTPQTIVGTVAIYQCDKGGQRTAEYAVPLLTAPSFVALGGTPPPPDTAAVLVSMPVGQFLATRPDLLPRTRVLGPDTGPGSVVRDDNGQIVAVRKLLFYRDTQ